MAKCRFCDKGGWFTSIDANGLCNNCAPGIEMHIRSTARVIAESVDLANEGKTFKSRLSRCDLIAKAAYELLQYEERGIPTVETPPSEFVRKTEEFRKEIILEEANKVADKARDKAEFAATSRTKSNALASGYLKVKEILAESKEPDFGAEILSSLKEESHAAKLDGYLEAARKAEFKGSTKKAIDKYQEALFFIKNDDVPDEQQSKEIEEIQRSLQQLQTKQ